MGGGAQGGELAAAPALMVAAARQCHVCGKHKVTLTLTHSHPHPHSRTHTHTYPHPHSHTHAHPHRTLALIIALTLTHTRTLALTLTLTLRRGRGGSRRTRCLAASAASGCGTAGLPTRRSTGKCTGWSARAVEGGHLRARKAREPRRGGRKRPRGGEAKTECEPHVDSTF